MLLAPHRQVRRSHRSIHCWRHAARRVLPRERFSPMMVKRTSRSNSATSENFPERPCSQRAACRVLPPPRLPLTIILAAAPARVDSLGVPIALEIEEAEAETVVARFVAVRNEDIG